MVLLYILVGVFATLRALGFAGLTALNQVDLPLRLALCLLFFAAACARWSKAYNSLVRMVPPLFPRPDLLVKISGWLELLGAIGLLLPQTARVAATCLAILLVAIFPANVYAARMKLSVLGRPHPGLFERTFIQIVLIAALLVIAWQKR